MKNIIVILTPENFPYGSAGANYLRNLSLGLVLNSKHSVEVWLQSGNSRPNHNFNNAKQGTIDEVTYCYIGGYALRPNNTIGKLYNSWLGFWFALFRLIKYKSQIHSLVIYNSASITSFFSLLICRLMKIQTVRIVPEWYEKRSVVTSVFKIIKWWDFMFSLKIMNHYFDKLIVLSHYLRKYYVDNGYPEDKIFILPNLVNLNEFEGESKVNDRKRKVIGYAGTPVKKDGIFDLIHAFRLLLDKRSDVELLIIGDISKTVTAIPSLKKLAEEHGIPRDQIRFTGLVDFKNVPLLLNSCDILILARPSGRFAEAGFPTKLGEYLACKKPVVLTKVGDIPRYFEDKFNAVLVEPDNPVSISAGMCYLLDNELFARDIAQRGYEWVVANMEYSKITSVVMEFIDKK